MLAEIWLANSDPGFPQQIDKSTQTLHNQWNTHTNTFWSSSGQVATKNTWRSSQTAHNITALKVICPPFFHLSESADTKLFSVQAFVPHLFISLQFTCQISHQAASSWEALFSRHTKVQPERNRKQCFSTLGIQDSFNTLFNILLNKDRKEQSYKDSPWYMPKSLQSDWPAYE